MAVVTVVEEKGVKNHKEGLDCGEVEGGKESQGGFSRLTKRKERKKRRV